MFEKRVREKIAELIERADAIESTPVESHGARWLADCRAWIAETVNVVELALPDALSPYRRQIGAAAIIGNTTDRVMNVASMLRSLLADVDRGLVGTITNKIRAETFDDFLDHAVEYRKEGRKEEAGVIAGVVFEDTVRKIYATNIGDSTGKPLEDVINELKKRDVITDEEKTQAQTPKLVRTRATHANWREFTLDGVDDTIKATKAFIKKYLE